MSKFDTEYIFASLTNMSNSEPIRPMCNMKVYIATHLNSVWQIIFLKLTFWQTIGGLQLHAWQHYFINNSLFCLQVHTDIGCIFIFYFFNYFWGERELIINRLSDWKWPWIKNKQTKQNKKQTSITRIFAMRNICTCPILCCPYIAVKGHMTCVGTPSAMVILTKISHNRSMYV